MVKIFKKSTVACIFYFAAFGCTYSRQGKEMKKGNSFDIKPAPNPPPFAIKGDGFIRPIDMPIPPRHHGDGNGCTLI